MQTSLSIYHTQSPDHYLGLVDKQRGLILSHLPAHTNNSLINSLLISLFYQILIYFFFLFVLLLISFFCCFYLYLFHHLLIYFFLPFCIIVYIFFCCFYLNLFYHLLIYFFFPFCSHLYLYFSILTYIFLFIFLLITCSSYSNLSLSFYILTYISLPGVNALRSQYQSGQYYIHRYLFYKNQLNPSCYDLRGIRAIQFNSTKLSMSIRTQLYLYQYLFPLVMIYEA